MSGISTPGLTEGPQPSAYRPIPLIRRHDLVTQEMTFQDIPYMVVKDPLSLQYHRLQPEEHRALELLDGQRSLDEIRNELQVRFPSISWNLRQVQDLLIDLHQKNLVRSLNDEQDTAALRRRRKKKWEKLQKTLKNFMFMRLPGWDPGPTLTAIYPYFRWMFSPAFLILAFGLWIWSLLLILMEWNTFAAALPEFDQFFSASNLVFLYFTIAFAKILHEFGHGLSCVHYGGECHEMGVMLLVFSPCLYCDVSDSWMLKNKWQRILIGGAGMIIEVILSSVALLIWWNTRPGLFHHLCFNLWVVSSVSTVVFNLNPLMRFDGYYIFSDWREIPNLRSKADRLFRNAFSKWCLGIDPPPDPLMPTRGKGWFITYAIAAWIYRWFLLFSITYFLYQVLKPYGLEFIGLTLGMAAIAGMLFTFVKSIVQIVRQPRTDPMDRRKPVFAVLIVVTLIGLILSIPLPYRVESEFLLQPREGEPVYVLVDGELTDLRVSPGETVTQGQVLAVLRNPQLTDRLEELRTELNSAKEELERAIRTNRVLDREVARQRVAALSEEMADFEDRVDLLTVTAPAAGVIVEPPEQPANPETEDGRRLPTWTGSPLDPENRHAFLMARTHLLTIAPRTDPEAVLLIEQADRPFFDEGSKIKLRMEDAPDATFVGQIETISHEPSREAAEALSNKAGGETATKTTEDGQEEVMHPVYRASVELSGPLHLIRPGFRGNAQIRVGSRSLGRRLWRYLNYTFAFRL